MDNHRHEQHHGGRRDLTSELAASILEFLAAEGMPPGTHIPNQMLADHFNVSRSPIGRALQLLLQKGVVSHQTHRGYFVAKDLPAKPEAIGLSTRTDLTRIYFALAEDRLADRLPDQVSETYLRQRYGLSRAQLSELLTRISQEGWAERRPGYGWTFSTVLRTTEALDQTYRLRMAIEPAALLEPTFRLSHAQLERAAEVERKLLAGAIETMSADELYERGVRYHEMLAEASGNPFFLETLRRVNRIRRLLAYRSMIDRRRYYTQACEHLNILELLRNERNEEAAAAMKDHLAAVVSNLQKIKSLLD